MLFVGPLAYSVSRTPITDRERLRLPFAPPSPYPNRQLISYIGIYEVSVYVGITRGHLYHSPSTLYTVYYVLCTLYTLLLSLMIIFFMLRIFTTIMNEIESTARRRWWEATYEKNKTTHKTIYIMHVFIYIYIYRI